MRIVQITDGCSLIVVSRVHLLRIQQVMCLCNFFFFFLIKSKIGKSVGLSKIVKNPNKSENILSFEENSKIFFISKVNYSRKCGNDDEAVMFINFRGVCADIIQSN